jgi:hypothetical protein
MMNPATYVRIFQRLKPVAAVGGEGQRFNEVGAGRSGIPPVPGDKPPPRQQRFDQHVAIR